MRDSLPFPSEGAVVLETRRLFLRRFSPDDEESRASIFGDPEVMRFGDGPKDGAWIRRWIDRVMSEYEARGGLGPWAVIETSRGELVGYCGLLHHPDVCGRAETEIGYRLARSHWGRGYATEAVLAVRHHGFETVGLERLIAIIDPSNVASIRVARKAGMSYERDVWFPGYTHPDHLYAVERSRL